MRKSGPTSLLKVSSSSELWAVQPRRHLAELQRLLKDIAREMEVRPWNVESSSRAFDSADES